MATYFKGEIRTSKLNVDLSNFNYTGNFTGNYTGTFTGNINGSSSYALTSSYSLGSITNFSTGNYTGTFTGNLQGSSSYATSASWSPNSIDLSTYATSTGVTGTFAQKSGSYTVQSSSYALSASYAPGSQSSTGLSEWTNTTAFTRTGDSTFTVTDNVTNQSIFCKGRPLRYKVNSVDVWVYGIIVLYSAGTITIAGAPFTTSIQYMEYGLTNKVIPMYFAVNGFFADATNNTLLASDMLTYVKWENSKAYLVKIDAITKVADTGATQPRINVSISGSTNRTCNTAGGLLTSAGNVWTNSGIAIDTMKYSASFGDPLEIATQTTGTATGATSAQDLTVCATFILE